MIVVNPLYGGEFTGDVMEEKKGPSKAQILKMAIDGLSPEEKEEFNKLLAVDMGKRPVNNKIELQVG